MSASNPLTTANAIAEPGRVLEAFLRDQQVSSWLGETHVDWLRGRLLKAPSGVVHLLRSVEGLAEYGITLTPSGMRILGRLQIDLESAAKSSSLAEHFEIDRPIPKGSSSIALKAVNRRLNRPVVLKILQPVLPELAESAMRRLGSLDGIPHLVAPIDSETFETRSVAGDDVCSAPR